MNSDFERTENIRKLALFVLTKRETYLGDVFLQIRDSFFEIEDRYMFGIAEVSVKEMRGIIASSTNGTDLFSKPIVPTVELSDTEVLQFVFLEKALHEFCYCCEQLKIATELTYSGSTSSRFYLNSIYYYVSTLFLINIRENKANGLSMGGTVITALEPLKLSNMLNPIKKILEKPLGNQWCFGEVIRRLRNKSLVHGDFSLNQLESMVVETKIRELAEHLKFQDYIWELFHQVIILDLRIVSILTFIGEDRIERALANRIKEA